jgi:hypothetical protein
MIKKLHQSGGNSPPAIRRLRDLTRQRVNLVRKRVRALHRLESVVEHAGIKMSTVMSRTLTMSGGS